MSVSANALLDNLTASLKERPFGDSEPAWLTRRREKALAFVAERGFPDMFEDTWKYTRVNPILETSFTLAKNADHSLSLAEVDRLAGNFGGIRLVFVNGRFAKELSSPVVDSKTATIANVGSVMGKWGDFLEERSLCHFKGKDEAFAALNAACATDGAFVKIMPDAIVEEPIHLAFLGNSGKNPIMACPESLIHVGKNARATIVETYAGASGSTYFTNAMTDVVLDEAAEIEHYKIQNEASEAFHIGSLKARQGENSKLSSHSVALGGKLARHETRIELGHSGASSVLTGLYLTLENQLSDNLTFVDHSAPNCTVKELYKGIIGGNGRGIFDGLILVREGAVKIDSSLTNRNLLISRAGQAYTRPQLKIYADDVKCAHGATVGQINEDALFYLRSRGIAESEGKKILTYAFMDETLDSISLESLRAYAKNLVSSRSLSFGDEGTVE